MLMLMLAHPCPGGPRFTAVEQGFSLLALPSACYLQYSTLGIPITEPWAWGNIPRTTTQTGRTRAVVSEVRPPQSYRVNPPARVVLLSFNFLFFCSLLLLGGLIIPSFQHRTLWDTSTVQYVPAPRADKRCRYTDQGRPGKAQRGVISPCLP